MSRRPASSTRPWRRVLSRCASSCTRRDAAAASIRHAVNAEAARFVVSSSQQIAILADSADPIQRVVIDATDEAGGTLVSEVLAHRGLDLIGLHCRSTTTTRSAPSNCERMIAEMSRIRREHAILLTLSASPASTSANAA